jgi:hypothetical protein
MIALSNHANATALSRHITQTPVLVITHAAYLAALREAQDSADTTTRLDMYSCYHHGTRKWLIIDEAINWTDAYEVDVDDLMAMCGALSGVLTDEATETLRVLSDFLRAVIDGKSKGRSDRLLSVDQTSMLTGIDISQLRAAIRALPKEATEVWRNTQLSLPTADLQPTTFKKQYIAVLERLQAIQLIGHCWLSQRGTRTRLHSSRSLLDTRRACGVILDATASIDKTYDLVSSNVVLAARPDNMRTYGNVTVHVSRSHRVGKEHLSKQAATDWPAVARQLLRHVTGESKVLVVTHKDVAPLVRRYGLKCGTLDVTHWGALDGKNDWHEYDTVVLFGLPYIDDITPTNWFIGSAGFANAWFDGRRQFGRYDDMKVAIKNGFIAKSVVQAINRVRCRTITDGQGACKATDVYILLPSGNTADAIISSIRQEMPGVRMTEWQATPHNRKPMARTQSRLLSLLQSYEPGTYGKSQIIAHLSIATRTFERMSIKMQKRDSVLVRELSAIGVKYDCTIGRGQEACFIKH